jgi:hypothetical protein
MWRSYSTPSFVSAMKRRRRELPLDTAQFEHVQSDRFEGDFMKREVFVRTKASRGEGMKVLENPGEWAGR